MLSKSLNLKRARSRPFRPAQSEPSEAQVARIDALTAAGRTNWIALLAYLAFALVTTLGVEDVDFFVNSRQTELPLIGVSIPTFSFFVFAPMLGAALYVYLQLHVRKLTEALAEPPPGQPPLEERVKPWLLNDFILRRRRDGAIRARPLDRLAGLTTLLLVWWSGPLALAIMWHRTWPAHVLWLSLLCATCVMVALYAGTLSWIKMHQDLGQAGPHATTKAVILVLLLVLPVGWLTTANSKGIGEYVVDPDTLRLRDSKYSRLFVSEPVNAFSEEVPGQLSQMLRSVSWWLTDLARLDEPDLTGARLSVLQPDEAINSVKKPNLSGRDLRRASLSGAHLSGINLSKAILEGANLVGARLERANLDDARMKNADLTGAQLQSASLAWTDLEGADLSFARLDDAYLFSANLVGANLRGAQLSRANLLNAEMQGNNLVEAKLVRTELDANRFKGGNLWGSTLKGVNLSGADLPNLGLNFASLESVTLDGARLTSSEWENAAISAVTARNTDFRAARFLTQSKLLAVVGNEWTLLPDDTDWETGERLFVPSCWRSVPSGWAELVESRAPIDEFLDQFRDTIVEEYMRELYLCSPGEVPTKTGTPWPLDDPPPWETNPDWQPEDRGPVENSKLGER